MTTTEAPAAARPAYVVLGTTDDVTECDHCGRTDLRSTIRLGALDANGEIDGEVYFGAVCGARAAGWTVQDFRAQATDADRAAREAARIERERAAAAALDAADALRGTADCPSAPSMCRRSGRACVAHS